MWDTTPRNEFKVEGNVPPAARLHEQLENYLVAAKGAYSRNSERALRADTQIFARWCENNELRAVPAAGTTVARFINDMAKSRASATLRRYLSSIATIHKAFGHDSPLESLDVRLAVQRMHREKGRRQKQALGLTWPLRNRLMKGSGDKLIDARNKALLAVAYDTLLRRSELVALQVTDLVVEGDGTGTILLRSSKTDSEGKGAVFYLARDSVAFVEEWLSRAQLSNGRLFRSLRNGRDLGEKLDASQISRIYKAMAQRAGLSEEVVAGISGHSTRVGPVQDMVACGIELPAILQAGRWKSTVMVQRYGERLLVRKNGAAQLAKLQNR